MVVIVEVTTCWFEEYANKQRPMEKQATDMTRKTRGERLIQMRTHQGTQWPGERLHIERKKHER